MCCQRMEKLVFGLSRVSPPLAPTSGTVGFAFLAPFVSFRTAKAAVSNQLVRESRASLLAPNLLAVAQLATFAVLWDQG